MSRIGVLIVDDSAVVRQVLTEILARDSAIEVIGAVSDPIFASLRMKQRWPDVIVLDVEMPRMDGVTFLRQIMDERPTPVVICSTLTEKGAVTTLEALAAGAVTVVTKPKSALKGFLVESGAELVAAVKAAAGARVRGSPGAARKPAGQRGSLFAAPGAGTPAPAAAPSDNSAAYNSTGRTGMFPRLTADAILSAGAPGQLKETTERIVVIGTSTGGTQALELVLKALPEGCPGIAIVQHMPEKFTEAFAQRLDGISAITVREARSGERLLPGHALVAPGGKHLLLKRSGAYYYTEVVDGPYVNRHKPSVDVLFRSAAKCAGRNAVGIIMTGMGDDGARGLKEMQDAGAHTVAQDENSCVVFGMPREAIALGAVREVVPLESIADVIRRAGAAIRPSAATR